MVRIWLGNEPLCVLIDEIHPLEITWTVADLISHGRWDCSHLRTHMPSNVLQQIEAIPLNHQLDVSDVVI